MKKRNHLATMLAAEANQTAPQTVAQDEANPYASPSIEDNDPPEWDNYDPWAERPLGITLLSLWHVFGGAVALFVLLVILLWVSEDTARLSEAMGGSSSLLLGVATFLSAIWFAAGIGMWRGDLWGWWLGAFYYILGTLRNGATLLVMLSVAETSGELPSEYYLFKFASRVVIHGLLFLYFFKRNVLRFFGLPRRRIAMAAALLVTVAILLLAGANGLYYVLARQT